ncbi:DUF2971 domain-containing protein [Telmatospirillum sp.]|uniref:DUF2971 domain-containing protein n=1 Tax=Telmatospirillum sp. TaxID=2079197 RepID=UPI002849F3A2|nr:DUF2971 domain-containing protein [Telmatospirillum sp.]MDR3440653.1 DUF2971 domain-containing protein [Telmatospirillum sp.]
MSDVLFEVFAPLFSDLREEDAFPTKRPLLAHYTSIPVLEAILRNNEVWLSNPLFMNDMEEVRFGINSGANLFLTSAEIESACRTKERFDLLKSSFNHYFDMFARDHALDTYIFCLSEHSKDDTDGLLSMWRGYGGNGAGAAIVFDSARINVRNSSPLIIAKVQYGSTEDRKTWLQQRVTQFSEIVGEANLPDDKLYLGSYWFFERLKLFSVFTKHKGFEEEKEWRVAYMRDRDASKSFDRMFSYWVGPRGVEPKLKFKIEHISGITEDDFSLSKIVERIILGPSLSSPLAHAAIDRMIDTLGLSNLKDLVKTSTIPFRSG